MCKQITKSSYIIIHNSSHSDTTSTRDSPTQDQASGAKMYPLSPVSVRLLLFYGSLVFSSSPPHGQSSEKDSLESTSGPYKFKPASVWRREADPFGQGEESSRYQFESSEQLKAHKSIEARLRRSIQKRLINSSIKDLPFRFHPALQLEFLQSST